MSVCPSVTQQNDIGEKGLTEGEHTVPPRNVDMVRYRLLSNCVFDCRKEYSEKMIIASQGQKL